MSANSQSVQIITKILLYRVRQKENIAISAAQLQENKKINWGNAPNSPIDAVFQARVSGARM
jgi:hypothetical protein